MAEGAERVMTLLKEMAVLKEENKAANSKGSEEQAHQERELRCEQILNEIKAMANQQKSLGSTAD